MTSQFIHPQENIKDLEGWQIKVYEEGRFLGFLILQTVSSYIRNLPQLEERRRFLENKVKQFVFIQI